MRRRPNVLNATKDRKESVIIRTLLESDNIVKFSYENEISKRERTGVER